MRTRAGQERDGGTPVLHRELRRRWANSLHVLDVGSQHFTYTPGLRYASDRTLRGVAIENFRDMAQPGIGRDGLSMAVSHSAA